MNPFHAINERRHDRKVERLLARVTTMSERSEEIVRQYERITGETVHRSDGPHSGLTAYGQLLAEHPDAPQMLVDNGVPAELFDFDRQRRGVRWMAKIRNVI